MFEFMHISELTGGLQEEKGSMKAIVIKNFGEVELVEVKKPRIMDGYIRVKVAAVALSLNDVQNVTIGKTIGGILGSDFSGIVEAVGENCNVKVKPGDKVYGACYGANKGSPDDGAFAEFVLVKEGHFARLAEGRMGFEEAATLGTGIMTVARALYRSLKIPLHAQPTQTLSPILIFGGDTPTGALAIQYAKLSGLVVIATSSPKDFDLVRSRGADAVFDYHDGAQCARQIKEYAQNRLHHILDCVSTLSSSAICAASFPSSSTAELRFVSLQPLESWLRNDVNTMVVQAQQTFDEAYMSKNDLPAMKEQLEFEVGFWEMTERLVAEGRIVPHPVTAREGGLGAIPGGIKEKLTGAVSGSTLVFSVL